MNNHKYLASVRQKIELFYKYPLKVAELARGAGVSESKLQHAFPIAFGTNIQYYQLQVRINKAKEYLEDTDNSLKWISFSVGYKSCRSFIRAFKKNTGTTPDLYRKQQQKNIFSLGVN